MTEQGVPKYKGDPMPDDPKTASRENEGATMVASRGDSALTYQASLALMKLEADVESDEESVIILQDLSDVGETASRNVATLQPVDEGFGAWSYVASAFAMYIVVWGFPNAFPAFQTYLSGGSQPKYPNSVVIPLLAPGIQDIEEGLLFELLSRFSRHRRLIVLAGIFTITFSMFFASYATAAWQIVLLQGVLFGAGGIMLNFVHVTASITWFDKKLSLAMGIIWLGWRVGSLGFPLICQWLLETHGYETTLRVLIAPMLALLLPSVFLLRGRYPVAAVVSKPSKPRPSKLDLLRRPKVAFYLLVATLFYTVVYVPLTFISRYGKDIGISRSDQAIAHALLVLSLMPGTYVVAWLSNDGFHPYLISCSAIISSLGHFLLLGFCKNRTLLFAYAVAIGLSSGGWDNCFFAFFAEITAKDTELFASIHSLFRFFSGIATLTIGPIGVALTQASPDLDLTLYAIGKYQGIVIYAGGMSFLSGIIVIVYTRFHRR